MRSINFNYRRQELKIRSSQGVAVVEFAIILPILVTFLVGMVEFGHVWFLQHALTNASREGARVGVVYRLSGSVPSWGYQLDGGKKVENTIKNFLGENFFNYHNVQVTVNTPQGPGTGNNLEVTVTAQQNVTLLLDALIKLFNPGFQGIKVGAVTTMRLE